MAGRSKSEAVDVPEHENRTDGSSRVDGRGHCGRLDRDVTYEEFSKRKGAHYRLIFGKNAVAWSRPNSQQQH
jgi:hypothetical protein